MLRVSIRTPGRTWPIRSGEPASISIMVTPLTGKNRPARRRETASRNGAVRTELDGPFHPDTCAVIEMAAVAYRYHRRHGTGWASPLPQDHAETQDYSKNKNYNV